MILYHGSNTMIDVIDLTKSKKYKDFGQAFYLSEAEEQARKMAVAKVVQFGGKESVTCFEFNEKCLSLQKLNVKIFTEYSPEWAEFVFKNRDENQDFLHAFDKVYNSRTYKNLLNPLSQLYYQSPGYVYAQMCEEES